MNKLIRNFLKAVILTAIFSSAVHAEHDNGQGKSQDDPLGFCFSCAGTLDILAVFYQVL